MKSFFYTLVVLFSVTAVSAQENNQKKFSTTMCETVTCYTVTAEDFVMQNWQAVFNAMRAKIPGIQIYDSPLNQTPVIRLRNQEEHIVYIDGVRTSMAALKNLNPADIESIKVFPNGAGVIPQSLFMQ